MKKQRREGGQVLVIIILAIVGLFGFAALAVDGGRVFAERRRAQNAADAAAVAAAFAGATGGNWATVGISSTTNNGYDDQDPTSTSTIADENVEIYNPPQRGRYSTDTETIIKEEYYQVLIRKKVPQVFSQIVYAGDLWVEVEAVAHSTGQKGFPYGAAIVATCPNCCDGLYFTGNGLIEINGGNAISNSNVTDGAKNPGCHSVERSGDAYLNINDGSLIAGGSLYNGGAVEEDGSVDIDALNCKDEDNVKVPCIDGSVSLFTPNPDTYDYPFEPSCKGLTTINPIDKKANGYGGDYKSDATLGPGIYPNGISTSGGAILTLTPGMYCLDDDLKITNGSIIGSNIMFTMRDGSVDIQTPGEVSLLAPTEEENCIADPDLDPDCWTGFLFYMLDSNDGTITLTGGGSATFTGTVYAVSPPAKTSDYKCTLIGGSEEKAFNASIICYTIKVSGNNGLTITYDDSLNAQSPGSIELAE